MTERANQLYVTADGQIAELIDLISALDEPALGRPCPGREKLGDGTLGAATRHTVDNYERIAAFTRATAPKSSTQGPGRHDGQRTPRLAHRRGHWPAAHAAHGAAAHAAHGAAAHAAYGAADHAASGPGCGEHRDQYTAENTDVDVVVTQLVAARGALGAIAELTDSQLDAIPPKDSFRFCDGQRTVEQVLAALLKHQRHQVDALKAARP
jgi:hypothetical protein